MLYMISRMNETGCTDVRSPHASERLARTAASWRHNRGGYLPGYLGLIRGCSGDNR